MARCIQLDMDCAAICRLAVGCMARGSEFAGPICEACAEECRRMASAHPRGSQAGQAAHKSAH